jgi:hypothetical protein
VHGITVVHSHFLGLALQTSADEEHSAEFIVRFSHENFGR